MIIYKFGVESGVGEVDKKKREGPGLVSINENGGENQA